MLLIVRKKGRQSREKIPLKDRNWSYLAGIFDGEGCAHIARVNYHGKGTAHSEYGYRVDVHITTTYKPLAEWLVRTFGGVYYTSEMKNDKWRTAFRWQPKGKKNKEDFFLGILPYLIIKREIVLLCLEFLRLSGVCPEKRSQLCDKARLLTRRGKLVETNTLAPEETPVMIESELFGDEESALPVTVDA